MENNLSFVVSAPIGLKEEGLFRLPGQMKDVQELKDAFNKGINCHYLPVY